MHSPWQERRAAVNGGYAFLHIYVSLAAEAMAVGRPNYKLRCRGSRGLAVVMLP
jgi:hypothetical protein